MQAATLMAIYIFTTIVMQIIGFGISQAVTTQAPGAGLMTFLILFMAAFGLAWPIAVMVTEWLIRRSGRVVQT